MSDRTKEPCPYDSSTWKRTKIEHPYTMYEIDAANREIGRLRAEVAQWRGATETAERIAELANASLDIRTDEVARLTEQLRWRDVHKDPRRLLPEESMALERGEKYLISHNGKWWFEIPPLPTITDAEI